MIFLAWQLIDRIRRQGLPLNQSRGRQRLPLNQGMKACNDALKQKPSLSRPCRQEEEEEENFGGGVIAAHPFVLWASHVS